MDKAKLVTTNYLLENILEGISKRTLYRWIKDNKIPYYRVGRTYMFDPDEVIEAIKGMRTKAKVKGEE